MYTVSLQREEPTSEGSNAGVLTLGGLPPGIPHDSLIWVPVQRYPSAIALFRTFDVLNVTVPSSLVDEVSKLLPQFTYRWQIPIDGMSVNGHLLPNSSGIPGSQLSALFDTVSGWLFCCIYLIRSDPQGNVTTCEFCHHPCYLVIYGNYMETNSSYRRTTSTRHCCHPLTLMVISHVRLDIISRSASVASSSESTLMIS
jgi:hypothetical protein